MWNYLKKKLSEASTWQTLFTLVATVGGIQIAPQLQEYIQAAALAILGLIGFYTNEEKK